MADTSTVSKVADLAKLHLTEIEVKEFSKDLEKILGFFDQLQAVDTTGVEPMVTPSDIEFSKAQDVVEKFPGAPEVFLEQAPDRQGNLYKVPPVV